MNRVALLCCVAAMLAGCGVKRPLIPPSEIPAYEAKRQKKFDTIERYKREQELQKSSPAPPAPAPATPSFPATSVPMVK
jgi:predicted small lipoprotein YifL